MMYQIRPIAQLRCELQTPCHPSTWFDERIRVSGIIAFAGDSYPAPLRTALLEQVSLEVLLEEQLIFSERARGSIAARAVSTQPTAYGGYFESLAIEDLSQDKVGTVEFRFEGLVNVAALIPRSEKEQTRNFYLTAIAKLRDQTGVSNTVQIALPPRTEWERAYGGFLFPHTGVLNSRFLVVEGWAARRDDLLERVELQIGKRSIGAAKIGLWSPTIAGALPNVSQGERAKFSAAFTADEILTPLRRRAQKKFYRGERLSVQALCQFSSGAELTIGTRSFLWLPHAPEFSPQGELESVAPDDEGRIVLRGWFTEDGHNAQGFRIHGARRTWSYFLPESNPHEPALRLLPRPDIDHRHLAAARHSNTGFELVIDPATLGRAPGIIGFSVQRPCGAWQPLDDHGLVERFRALHKQLLGPQSLRIRALRSFTKWFGGTLLSESTAVSVLRPRETVRTPAQSEHIVFATHNLSDVEGAPRVLWDLICHVREYRPDVRLTVVSALDGPARQQLQNLGIAVICLPGINPATTTWELYHRSLRQLEERLQDASFVYANTGDSFWAIDAAQRLGLPSVWAIHESQDPRASFPWLDSRLRTQFLERVSSETQKFVFVSRSSAELFHPLVDPDRIHVIPNGIDSHGLEREAAFCDRFSARRQLGIGDTDIVVSIVGTTTERKGQATFLRAMERVRRDQNNRRCRFLVVGARPGEYLNSLIALADELGITNDVTFVPETPHVIPYFRASDVVVIASSVESAPLVSLEAMALGIPLVSTRAFGLGEQLVDNETALTFEIGDDLECAQQVRKLLGDSELRERLIRQALQVVRERFVHRAALDQHLGLIFPAKSHIS